MGKKGKGKKTVKEVKLSPEQKVKWEGHAMAILKQKKGSWVRESEIERAVTNENRDFKAMAENSGRMNNMGRDAAGILKTMVKEGKIETDKMEGQRFYAFIEKD